jgi:hypothetical protein
MSRIASAFRNREVRVWLGVLLVEAVLGALVLGFTARGSTSLFGGDAVEYQRYAVNLVDHGSFSLATTPPYYPSVFRTPGYPAFLAGLRLLDPDSLVLVRIVQFGLVAATAIVSYRLALYLAGGGTAVLSAVLCATYLPLVWLAAWHASEVLATFLLTLSVWALQAARRAKFGQQRVARAGGAGAALGLLTLVRPAFALLVIPLAIGLGLSGEGPQAKIRAASLLLMVVGFAAVIAPWTARNYVVSEQFVPLGAGSGLALYLSAKQYAGTISIKLTPLDWSRHLADVRRVQSKLERQARLARPPPSSYLASLDRGIPLATRVELALNQELSEASRRLFRRMRFRMMVGRVPRREAYLWGTADYPPLGRLSSVAHRIAQAQWGVLVLLAAIGVWSVRARWRDFWPLLVVPAYLSCVHLIYHVEGRFSLPARPLLIIFSAMGAAWILKRTAGLRASVG